MPRRAAALLLSILASLAVVPPPAAAQTPRTGASMYEEWCAVCHGADGRGRPAEPRVATVPIDFTDCGRTTSETDADWTLVVTQGGIAAGLSSDMPGFELLSDRDVAAILAYVRSFCREPGWPDGNLNFPRSTIAAKAFPEHEVVVAASVSHAADFTTRGRLEASYAFRLGKRTKLEVTVPAEATSFVGRRVAGIGDVSAEAAHVIHASARRGTIVAAGLEASAGTGSRRWGFGEGTAVFEPFVAAGWGAGAWVVQGDVRVRLPVRQFAGEVVHRVEYAVSALRPLGRLATSWTVGIGVSGLGTGTWVSPEVLRGLTRTGSLSAGFGAELPVRPVGPAVRGSTTWRGYVLWDYLEPLTARR